jgi:hypothetical protein
LKYTNTSTVEPILAFVTAYVKSLKKDTRITLSYVTKYN